MSSFEEHVKAIRDAQQTEQKGIAAARKMFIDSDYFRKTAEAGSIEEIPSVMPQNTPNYEPVQMFTSKPEAMSWLKSRDTNPMNEKKPIVRKKVFGGKRIAIVIDPNTGLEETYHATRGWLHSGRHPVAVSIKETI